MNRRKSIDPIQTLNTRARKAGTRTSPISKPRYVCKAERAMSSAVKSANTASVAVAAVENPKSAVRGRRLSRRNTVLVTGSRLKF
ncbi:DUF2986 domain-containing protein [Marinobacterium rhizophilum]|uniref:DUF2986 domain-containing protein n=1 Tax=Marinobacterium rhizophilum TaxID=420402 RepID=UPI0012EBB266|nr:DUF2986 domain-containing protein [Marinobacterium rhizophilum]